MAEQSAEESRTAQEHVWGGTFGSEYIERNPGEAIVAANLAFFSRALRQTRGVGVDRKSDQVPGSGSHAPAWELGRTLCVPSRCLRGGWIALGV